MNKKLKRALSCMLAVVMLVCAVPVGVIGTKAGAVANIPSDAVEFNGHYYLVYLDSKIGWHDAQKACEDVGGYLATISSEEENQFIYNLVSSYNVSCWLGATDEQEEGNWKWVTNEKWDYCKQRFDNRHGKQHYLVMNYYADTWDDQSEKYDSEGGFLCNTGGYICEWESGEITIKGTLDSYVISVVLDDGKNWVSEVTISGKKYKVKEEKLTNKRAESMQGKEVVATVKDGEIIDIELLDDVLNMIVSSKDSQNKYGANLSGNTLIGDIQQNVISLYQNLNSVFINYKDKVRNGVSTSQNDVILLAEDLKRSGELASASLNFYNQEVQNGFYLAFAECMLNDMGLEAIDIGNINFSSTTNAATKMANQMLKSFKSVNKQYTVNSRRYTFNIAIEGDAFTGSCTINENSLVNPPIMVNSSVKKTFRSLTNYVEHLSEKVNEGICQAFWSPLKDIADVTGLSEYTESQINAFLSKSNQQALKKAGFGDAIKVFINLKKCYNAVSAIKNASTASELIDALKKGQEVYDALNGLNFSNLNYGDVMTKAEKKMLDELKERVKKSIYNYIHQEHENGEEEKGWFESAWDKFTQFIGFHCPVDFEVYDKDNNLIGWVDTVGKHEESVWYTDDIMIGTYDDAKYLFLPENFEVTLKMTATDSGVMDCIIEQKNDNELSRLNYYDVKLENGKTFDIKISSFDELADIKDSLTVNNESANAFYKDSDAAFSKIDVEVIGNGVVTGAGEYPYGDLVKLNAIERDDATVFVGWYENDKLVSNNHHIQFTSKENRNLVAKFADKYMINSQFYAIEGDDYADIYAELYSVSDTESKISLSFVDENIDLSELNVKCFDEAGNVGYTGTVKLERNNDVLVSGAIKTSDVKKIEITDKGGKVVATFAAKYSSLVEPSAILINGKEKELEVGESFDLLFNVTPLYACSDVEIVSSDENVVTVAEDGTVTAVGAGEATITITSKINNEINAKCRFIVVDYSNSDPSENCNHICHKGGFVGFIYKIVRLFWKLFGINKTCKCGVNHY